MPDNDDLQTPSREALLAKAVELQPLLRHHAAAAEKHRRAADEVIDAMTAAGFFRLLTPIRFGGYQTDIRTAFEVCEAVSEADASAGWLLGIAAVSAWVVEDATERAQQEVFGAGPDAKMAGGVAAVPARRVHGGLRISGRWAYASGSFHARWAAISGSVDDGGQPVPYYCLVPASEVRLEQTWYTIGMRATGSNTWIADDVFVPEHRLIPMTTLVAGQALTETARSAVPFVPLATLFLLPAILGAGHAALTLVLDAARTKPMQYSVFPRQGDSVGVQLQVSEAELKLRTARLHAYKVAEELDELGEASAPEYADRARHKAMCSFAARQVLDALDILVSVHGAGTFAETNPLQRYWRDANTAARHAGLNHGLAGEVYGKDLLAIDETVSTTV